MVDRAALLAMPGVLERPFSNGVAASGNGALPLALDPEEFTLDSAARLVALIGDDERLGFFDAAHPQVSDRGLYVSIQRDDGIYVAQGGNHGWGYPWFDVTDAEVARWLWLCRADNDGGDAYESNVCSIGPARPMTEPKWSSPTSREQSQARVRNWLDARLAG